MAKKTPIQTLRDEHVMARKIVAVLELQAKGLKTKKPVSLLHLKEVAEIVRTAMESHHKKEMETFPYLVESEGVTRKDLLDALSEEHKLGYEYLSNVLRIINQEDKGEQEKYELLPFHLEKYTELLRTHIEKEEEGFFPLIEEYVTEGDRQALRQAFENVDKKFQSQSAFDFISRLKA